MQDKQETTPLRHDGASHQVPLSAPPPKKGGVMGKIVWLVILLAAVGGGYYYYHHQQPADGAQARGGGGGGARRGGGGGGAAVPVVVSTALKQDLPVYLDGLGSVVAEATVSVQSRVVGELTEVDFKEGQDVKKGDLLAVIDPRPYQVALAQAEAMLSRDQAQLKDAQLDKQRYMQLAKEGVIPQQQSDTQNALADQLNGAVQADMANIDSAKLNITYSHISSPIDGRIGLRLVDPGNIIQTTATASPLLLITQMEPITVIFTLPEDSLNSVTDAMKRGTMSVKAMSRDNGTELDNGSLLTIDNTIDQTTGTYKLRAIFNNKDRRLWPNQFVNARLLLNTQHDATVIPTAAIQNGGNGTFVYTVASDKTAQVSPITVGVTEGNSVSVAKGVSPGDVVVIDGQERLRSGMAVDARTDNRLPGGPGGGGSQASADNQPGRGPGADGGGQRRRGGDGQGGNGNGQYRGNGGGNGGGNRQQYGGNGGGNGKRGDRPARPQGGTGSGSADNAYPK